MRERQTSFSPERRRKMEANRVSSGRRKKAKEKWREAEKRRQEEEEEQRRLHQPRGEEEKEEGASNWNHSVLRTSSLGSLGRMTKTKGRLPLLLGEPKMKMRQRTTGCGWNHTKGSKL